MSDETALAVLSSPPPPPVQLPSAPPDEEECEGLSMLDVVERIRRKEMFGDELTMDARRACVDYLTDEGHSSLEIAKLLGVSDRTIERDRASLRREQALQPTLELGDEMLGELKRITHKSIQRLMRLAADPQTPTPVRVRSQEAALRAYQQFLDTAHRLEYINGGHRRIQFLRDTDPEEISRRKLARKADAQRCRI